MGRRRATSGSERERSERTEMLRRIRFVKVLLGASLLAGTIFAVPPAYGQKFEELALTPPMGWNSWNHFGCDINEQIVREVADAIVTSGMRDAGYEYVNLDDCWHRVEGRRRQHACRSETIPIRDEDAGGIRSQPWTQVRHLFGRRPNDVRWMARKRRHGVHGRRDLCIMGRGLLEIRLVRQPRESMRKRPTGR